jgi:hypothetical protein
VKYDIIKAEIMTFFNTGNIQEENNEKRLFKTGPAAGEVCQDKRTGLHLQHHAE